MSAYKTDKKLNKNFKKIFNCNRSPANLLHRFENKIKNFQTQNDNVLGTKYMDLNDQPDLHYDGMDVQAVG